MLASLVGRLPGILTLTLFGVQVEYAMRKPGLLSFALLIAGIIVMTLVIPLILKRLHRRHGG
jgi:uncharacterized membrane protein YdjX (TVP38/TMEM64 family)